MAQETEGRQSSKRTEGVIPSRILHEVPSQARRVDRTNLGDVARMVSLIGGVGRVATGFLPGRIRRVLAFLGGVELIRQGITGNSYILRLFNGGVSRSRNRMITRSERSITILRPREELYRVWTHPENFPSFMENVYEVRRLNERQARWFARDHAGRPVEWTTEITDQRDNELISWRTLDGAPMKMRGRALFFPAPQDKGTEVRVLLDCEGNGVESSFRRVAGEDVDTRNRETLRRFKQLMETGEIPTSEPYPAVGIAA